MKTKNQTKKALLMSAMSLLLCFSMLIGTTFAWFTDEVSTKNNIIKSGNLDVELYYQNDEVTDWKKVDANTNIFKETLWEPGHTEVIYFKVVNEGSLAFKYQLGVNIAEEIGGTNQDDETFKLSDYIEFGVVDLPTFARYNGRAAALEAIKDDAKIISEGYAKSSMLYSANDKEGNTPSEEYVALVVTMPEDVGNVANYKTSEDASNPRKYAPSITLGVDVYATQVENEKDSFDENYDKDVMITVSNFEELKAAINDVNDGGVIYVKPGVVEFKHVLTVTGKNFTIEGVGDNVLFKNIGGSGDHFFNITGESNVVFRNLKMDGNKIDENGAAHGKNGVFVRYNSIVTFDNCEIYNTKGSSICIDQVSDMEAVIGGTAYVNLINNTKVERISACAFPTSGHAYDSVTSEDSFVKVTCDPTSSIDSFVKDSWAAAENITLNGTASVVATVADIYAAVANAQDGDTIFINAGTYELTNILVDNKSIEIIGIGNVTLKATSLANHLFQLRNGANGNAPVADMKVTIKNMTLSGEYKNAINIRNDLDLAVEDITFAGTYKYGDMGVENAYASTNGIVDGVVNVHAENVTANWVTMAAGASESTNFTYKECNFSAINVQALGGSVTINGAEVDTPSRFVSDAESMQKAINEATGNYTVYFLDDITGDVTVTQNQDVKIVIDGNEYKYTGTIYVNGNRAYDNGATLTIQNVNFVTDVAEERFIEQDALPAPKGYPHNITVDNCTFTATGAAKYTAKAVHLRQPQNITIKNSEANGLHSLAWVTGGKTFTVDNVTLKDCKNGIHVGTMSPATIKNCNIESVGDYGYGVRIDASGAYSLTVENCTINADAPVLVRKASGNATVALNYNTLNPTSGGSEYIITAADYEEGVTLTPATGNITLIIDGKQIVTTPIDVEAAPLEEDFLFPAGTDAVMYKDMALSGDAQIVHEENAVLGLSNVTATVEHDLIVRKSGGAICISDCEFTLENDAKLITLGEGGGANQVFLINVKVNGELLTDANVGQYLDDNIGWVGVYPEWPNT